MLMHQDANVISTHSAREDGDILWHWKLRWYGIFQPTPPARTETSILSKSGTSLTISTHSAREDGDEEDRYRRKDDDISTHSAREDGDVNDDSVGANLIDISTHSAREDGDLTSLL